MRTFELIRRIRVFFLCSEVTDEQLFAKIASRKPLPTITGTELELATKYVNDGGDGHKADDDEAGAEPEGKDEHEQSSADEKSKENANEETKNSNAGSNAEQVASEISANNENERDKWMAVVEMFAATEHANKLPEKKAKNIVIKWLDF